MRSLVWMAVLVCGVAGAQMPESVPQKGGPVKTSQPADLLLHVQAMPLVLQVPMLKASVVDRINAASRRMDTKVKAAAQQCTTAKSSTRIWNRSVAVTMRGPRYFSLYTVDDSWCSGEHPDAAILPLVYDLNTGGTVNWLKLLPPGVTSGVDNASDGNKVGAVIWPVLTALARGQAGAGCAEVFEAGNAVPFVLWLDAKAGAIKAQPSDLPHSLIQCADKHVMITVEEARRMGGFNEELLDALEAARKLQR